MVFVKYDPDLKFIVVKMKLRGMSLREINATIDKSVSADSVARWMDLFHWTNNVVRDPALYADRGPPLAVTPEEAAFILDALEHEPTLYLDEIQSHIAAMTGICHPTSTIRDELKTRLQFTKKTARTVHPSQCPVERADFINQIGPFPSKYLVFIGM